MESTQILIVDEVSFLSQYLFIKLDKHMHVLKEDDTMHGGAHIIFVGEFFQMLPCGRETLLFKDNTLQFGAINKVIFLNVSHGFEDDPVYGEIMRRFRMGLVTKEDIKTINSRFIGNSNVSLPPITNLRCTCYTNEERNAYSNSVFIEYLKSTHQKTNDRDVICPDHNCILKSYYEIQKQKDKGFQLQYV